MFPKLQKRVQLVFLFLTREIELLPSECGGGINQSKQTEEASC